NLQSAQIQNAKYLNAYDVLKSRELVFTKAGLAVLESRLSGKKVSAPVAPAKPKPAPVQKAAKVKKKAVKRKPAVKKAKVVKKVRK
ncbi:MAG: hypothetical protein WEC39_00340, partial [Patescibacteria group bacterium]